MEKIDFVDSSYNSQITEIWKEAFDDSGEFISEFLKSFPNTTASYLDKNTVKGIMSLLPVNCGTKKGRYVYAVAVSKNYRNFGIGTSLLEFAKEFIREKKEDFLVLVPATENLCDYYARLGFTEINRTKQITGFSQEKECIVKKISANKYYEIRKKHYEATNLIEWDPQSLEKICKLEKGEFAEILLRGKSIGAAFYTVGKEINIFELICVENNQRVVLSALKNTFSKDCLCFVYDNSGKIFSMIYPKENSDSHFSIAIN